MLSVKLYVINLTVTDIDKRRVYRGYRRFETYLKYHGNIFHAISKESILEMFIFEKIN